MKKRILTEYSAEKLLGAYLPIAKSQLVKNVKQIQLNEYPLFLKIISKEALHKSDIHGVRKVYNKIELEREFNELFRIVKKRRLKLQGILVQKSYDGTQLIIGIKKDKTFGHVLLFGLGGVFTELLDDVSIRKCPIDLNEAEKMINELKARDIFYGARGNRLNLSLLKSVLVKVSKIPLKFKDIEELDLNPFILNEREGVVADARLVRKT